MADKKKRVKKADDGTCDGWDGFGGWVDTSWRLPEGAKKELDAIFPPAFIPAVEDSCRVYLAFKKNEENRPSSPADGIHLLEIADAAEVLAKTAERLIDLLDQGKWLSPLERLEDHAMSQWKNGDQETGLAIGDFACLRNELVKFYSCNGNEMELLAKMARSTPAAGEAGKKGRPLGKREAERILVNSIAKIYEQAHGKWPGRITQFDRSGERGPMAKIMRILAGPLGLGSDLTSIYRELKEAKESMDNK